MDALQFASGNFTLTLNAETMKMALTQSNNTDEILAEDVDAQFELAPACRAIVQVGVLRPHIRHLQVVEPGFHGISGWSTKLHGVVGYASGQNQNIDIPLPANAGANTWYQVKAKGGELQAYKLQELINEHVFINYLVNGANIDVDLSSLDPKYVQGIIDVVTLAQEDSEAAYALYVERMAVAQKVNEEFQTTKRNARETYRANDKANGVVKVMLNGNSVPVASIAPGVYFVADNRGERNGDTVRVDVQGKLPASFAWQARIGYQLKTD